MVSSRFKVQGSKFDGAAKVGCIVEIIEKYGAGARRWPSFIKL
jgi:hypothetical protein